MEEPMQAVAAIGAERRLYSDSNDKVLRKSDQEVLELFQKAQESLNRFLADVNQIGGFLFQRKAQIGSIAKDHLDWKKSLEESEDAQTWTSLHRLYEEIPLLKDPRNVAAALKYMMQLESVAYPLRQRYEELILILGSSLHHEALEFYKVKKLACKEVKKATNPLANKVDALRRLLKETNEQITKTLPQFAGKYPSIERQTALLYEELVKFLKYSASTMHLPQAPTGWFSALFGASAAVEPTEEELQALETIIQDATAIEAKIAPHSHSRSKKRELQASDRELVTQFLQQSQDVVLASEDDFRNGAILSVIGRYNDLSQQIEHLKSIAKALTKLLHTITDRIQTVAMANIAASEGFDSTKAEQRHYERLMRGLEERLHDEETALTQLPISSRVHAGWYYVAKLHTNAREVRRYIGIFKQMTHPEFSIFANCANWLIEYLEQDSSHFASAVSVSRLYASIQGHCQLVPPNDKECLSTSLRSLMYTTTEQIIATKGQLTLELTPAESRVALLVRNNRPLEEFEDDSIRTYLTKSFIRHLHFLEKVVDAEFEVVLNTLKTAPQYEPFFQKLLKSLEFAQHHAAYLEKTDMHRHLKELTLMAKILAALQQNPARCTLENLLSYCHARQLMHELKLLTSEEPSPQQKARLEWFHKQLEPLLLARQHGLPDYFPQFETIVIPETINCQLEPVFYRLVSQSLFAESERDKHSATIKLIQLLHVLPVEDLPQHKVTIQLLSVWALEHFSLDSGYEIPYRDLFLTKLFSKYLLEEPVT